MVARAGATCQTILYFRFIYFDGDVENCYNKLLPADTGPPTKSCAQCLIFDIINESGLADAGLNPYDFALVAQW